MKYTDEEAIEWANKRLKQPNPPTDGGCTFAPDLNFKECCKRHDVMVNGNVFISDRQAHRILRRCITKAGWPNLAKVYWLFVTMATKVGGANILVGMLSMATIITLLYFFG